MSTEPQRQKEQAPDQHTPPDQGTERNDPAIDPQEPDTVPASSGHDGQRQNQQQSQSQSQSQGSSEKSAYVPDYEPQEKPQTQRNHQPTQGVDADIDTQGG